MIGGVFCGGHGQRFAGADVELGAMSWAGNGVIIEPTVAQRAAVVGADVVDAKELPADVHQHHDAIFNLQ